MRFREPKGSEFEGGGSEAEAGAHAGEAGVVEGVAGLNAAAFHLGRLVADRAEELVVVGDEDHGDAVGGGPAQAARPKAASIASAASSLSRCSSARALSANSW